MKMKLVNVVAAMGIILAVTGTVNAVELQLGPSGFKTFNWEVGMNYDGTAGFTYFRDATTPGYDPLNNPTHKLFSDPSFSFSASGEGLLPNEDMFGLVDLYSLCYGTVTGGGTDIAVGTSYWAKGDNSEYLRGMFWGGQDQRVYIGDDGEGGKEVRIYTTDVHYNIYEMNTDFTGGGPQVEPTLEPGDRDGVDYFTGWRGNGEGTLQAEGISSFFRFESVSGGTTIGQTELYLDVTGGAWDPLIDDFWTVPSSVGGLFDGGAPTDLKQSWTILSESGPWIKSEDVGKGYVIPEPTMIGLLGLGALAVLRRKRSS